MTEVNTKKVIFALFLIVACVTLLLRFELATINREANDNHQRVIHIIMSESRLPNIDDDWEGFQPKLYHWSFAQTFLLLHLFDNAQQLIVIQYVNCVLGLGVLWMIWDILRRMPIENAGRFWALVLMISNPCLIAIFAQATNDGFVIFFVSLATYSALRFFKTNHWFFFLLMAASTIFAGLSKGNGLVAMAVIGGVCFVRLLLQFRNGNRSGLGLRTALFAGWIMLFLAIVPYFGQYIERFQETGKPFPTNMPINPLPTLWSHGEAERPGVVSLRRSYLSFPIQDLLQTPIISTESRTEYPIHRTNLWAQLYGQMNFAHFSEWPPSWATNTPFIQWLGRCIFILALFPTLTAAAWFLRIIVLETLSFFRKRNFTEENILHILLLCGYFTFIFIYTWEIRDFATMKPIFVLPAVISFSFFLAGGLDGIFRMAKNRFLQWAMHGALGALTILFWLDIFSLVLHLNHIPFLGG
jgi:hypothetical protein